MTNDLRHADADRSMVSVERSDVIDAAAGLHQMAANYRRQAKSRRNAGAHNKAHRAWLRDVADLYEAAAVRMQRAADDAI